MQTHATPAFDNQAWSKEETAHRLASYQYQLLSCGNEFALSVLVNSKIPEAFTMARFFFHIRRNGVLEMDTEGVEFSDHEAAHADAVRFVREMLAERIMNDSDVNEECVQIVSETGDLLSAVECCSLVKMGRLSSRD
ncbi:DUF6894 family protein [Rhizobium rhizoryzae]|uniref:DUF6894 domain-containing protein n=1 Tax=Rhizobium rhizoryzae TaxID=451876 RepID=A0A7W6LMK6_9HYPH|nr:hypothetical protein [Rhizobium rhizoryzae]MBB4145987.1 hypothetical protein [Rhizobium rhizoryzae]